MKRINTKTLQTLDKLYVWHPFTRMREWLKKDPIIIERGKGNYLIDTDGRRYLDGVSSLWVNIHGHGKKEIDRAIEKQLKKIAHSTLLGLGNRPSIMLAEKLIKIAPAGLKKVFYSDNGSTAVEAALKMSFNYFRAKKKKFLSFTGAYHGDTIGGMSVGEIDAFVEKYRPILFKTFKSPYPYCYRCPIKKKYPDCKLACLDVFENILKKHSRTIAACIIEPTIEGAAGMIVSPKGFLKGVRRLTKKYNVLLIADEVATGFGRTGKMFACEHEGVTPDILCLAKGITGGYLPLAATLTTEKIYKAFLGTKENPDAFYHGHTYTGNPLGCASAIANLNIFEKEETLKKIQPKIRLFKKLLKEFSTLPHAGDVRHIGLMAGVELVKNKKTKEPYPVKSKVAANICMDARKKGIIIRPLGDTLVIMPPLSIEKNELEKIFSAVFDSTRKITEGLGFFP